MKKQKNILTMFIYGEENQVDAGLSWRQTIYSIFSVQFDSLSKCIVSCNLYNKTH